MENTFNYTEQLEEIYSELNYITTTMEIVSGEKAEVNDSVLKASNSVSNLLPLICILLIVNFFTNFLFK